MNKSQGNKDLTKNDKHATASTQIFLEPSIEPSSITVETVEKPVNVTTMKRAESRISKETILWIYIRNTTNTISFKKYCTYIQNVMCNGIQPGERKMYLPFPGVDRYHLLKTATEIWMMSETGIWDDLSAYRTYFPGSLNLSDEEKRLETSLRNSEVINDLKSYFTNLPGSDYNITTLPYLELIRFKLKDAPLKPDQAEEASNCFGILTNKLSNPLMLELIWSYWHEESMLVQTMNAISMRFQNKLVGSGMDPLSHLELDPLRPLNNLLWGYVSDTQHRLTVNRRNLEYLHQYGLPLQGRAIRDVRAVDTRSKFLESFHNLLHLCWKFYKEDDDTTVVADPFPVLNALKATHLILTQGAHNQYGDLPSTSRMEMLMEEWLLSRPEIREFLPGRIMMDYPEEWMERVEVMKKLQGWSDTSVLHFRDLAIFGEQILLSVRYHSWSNEHIPETAKNWARYWRPEIQGYIHAYQAVTGVDVTRENPDSTPPSVHLQRRLVEQIRSSIPRSDRRQANQMGIAV